eukprot:2937250-Pyramimonas_sp.AAC.1
MSTNMQVCSRVSTPSAPAESEGCQILCRSFEATRTQPKSRDLVNQSFSAGEGREFRFTNELMLIPTAMYTHSYYRRQIDELQAQLARKEQELRRVRASRETNNAPSSARRNLDFSTAHPDISAGSKNGTRSEQQISAQINGDGTQHDGVPPGQPKPVERYGSVLTSVPPESETTLIFCRSGLRTAARGQAEQDSRAARDEADADTRVAKASASRGSHG